VRGPNKKESGEALKFSSLCTKVNALQCEAWYHVLKESLRPRYVAFVGTCVGNRLGCRISHELSECGSCTTALRSALFRWRWGVGEDFRA
jgi:hypothetical protein